MSPTDDDTLDGCDLSANTSITPDNRAGYIALFADVKPGLLYKLRVARKRRQWEKLFGRT